MNSHFTFVTLDCFETHFILRVIIFFLSKNTNYTIIKTDNKYHKCDFKKHRITLLLMECNRLRYMHSIRIPSRIDLSYILKLHFHKNTLNGTVLSLFPDRQWTIYEMPNSM